MIQNEPQMLKSVKTQKNSFILIRFIEPIKNRIIALCLLEALILPFLPHNLAQKPNIVFIFSDDLSFRDLSAYGQTNYATPNIDQLIGQSTRFTQAYAGAPECAPSRGTMLTGLHVGHSPIRLNSSARGFEPLPDSAYTFAEMLQESGYKTGVIGKWGLGFKDTEGRPNNQGFDYHFGFLTHYEAHSYFPLVLYENDQTIPFPENQRMDINALYQKDKDHYNIDFEGYYDEEGKLVNMDLDKAAYVPDLLDQKALSFMKRNQNNPFLLYYTTNLPHGPTIVDHLRQLKDRKDIPIKSREWGAMVQRLDLSVGKIIHQLKELDLFDQTIIVFASDNGYSMHGPSKTEEGEREWKDDSYLSNKGPFRGGKFGVLEGGMRIPFFVRMPGQNKPKAISTPVWLLDLFPTFAEVAGKQLDKKLDGFSLVSLLENNRNTIPLNRLMYFYKQNEQAIRQGPWFAFRDHPQNTIELFLPEEDQDLQVNLATIYPEKVKELTAVMDHIHQPSEWYWNPGDTRDSFRAKQEKAKKLGQIIKRYRPNGLELMPWERKN